MSENYCHNSVNLTTILHAAWHHTAHRDIVEEDRSGCQVKARDQTKCTGAILAILTSCTLACTVISDISASLYHYIFPETRMLIKIYHKRLSTRRLTCNLDDFKLHQLVLCIGFKFLLASQPQERINLIFQTLKSPCLNPKFLHTGIC